MKHLTINIILALFASFILNSCVPQEKYDQLMSDNIVLQGKIDSLGEFNDSIIELNNLLEVELDGYRQKEIENKLYTNQDAMEYLKDYYKFYATDKTYKNAQVRKTSYNTFHISLNEKNKGEHWLWYSQVKYLTINSDGTYRIR